ncbi:MAG: hypothetical protein KDA17_05835 [Candidatus Saccharibacteria bacterium]|nr:hypothetical protein [Candidatus Saccharibacteria bacterium]
MLEKEPTEYGVYRHTKTQNEYVIVSYPEVKVGGQWLPGVTYVSMKDGDDRPYVRTMGDFMQSFEEV